MSNFLKFVTDDRVALRDLSDVTPKGLCHDVKVEGYDCWFSAGSHSCVARLSCAGQDRDFYRLILPQKQEAAFRGVWPIDFSPRSA